MFLNKTIFFNDKNKISSYDPETVGYEISNEIAATEEHASYTDDFDSDENDDLTQTLTTSYSPDISYIEYQLYSCSACGAEVSVNGVESATFCVYCGQPTILPDRVVRGRAPERIIPFSIPKERAIQKIHDYFNTGIFIPKDVVDCKPDHVRGIYIPYWLVDMNYEQQSILKYKLQKNKQTVTEYSYRWGKCDFKNITVDASKQLDNAAAHKLDPYNLNALKPFDMSYLSGYYADCGDINDQEVEELANLRAMVLMKEDFKKNVSARTHGENISVLDTKFRSNITKKEYVMLPAWFMTFRYNHESYTFMVNGQTGKVIGASPFDKRNTFLFGSIIFLFITVIFLGIARAFGEDNVGMTELSMLIAVACGGVCYYGQTLYKKLKNQIKLSKSDSIINFVSNRQGDDYL